MKPFINFKLKTAIKKLAVLGLTSALIVSCGSDKNKSNDNSGFISNPVFPAGPQGQAAASEWNSLKSQHTCGFGMPRTQDLNFTIQTQGGPVAGQLNPGVSSGNIVAQFVGMNVGTKDLIYVQQISSGAFNVVLSLCTYQSQYGGWFIDPQGANLSNFQITSPLMLQNSTCPGVGGLVLDGWVTFTSNTYGGPIPTRFASGSCL